MSIFRKEAIKHRSEPSWGEVILFQPFSYTLLSYLILFFTLLGIIVVANSDYQKRSTVTGYLTPKSGLTKFYPLARGVVSEVHVKEGDVVKSGQKLVTVSTIRSTKDVGDIDAALVSELKMSELLLEEKLYSEERLGEVRLKKLSARILGLTREIAQQKKNLETANRSFSASKKQLSSYKELIAKGAYSESQYQEEYKKHIETQLGLQTIESKIIVLQNSLATAKLDQEKAPIETDSLLIDLKQSISEIRQRYTSIEGKSGFTLYSSIDGRVTALQAVVGRSVDPDKLVLAILPENSVYEAVLFVPTHSIGFVESGQQVKIRYNAFPYQRFGLYLGTVADVSDVILAPDDINSPVTLIEPVYRISVTLKEQSVSAYGKELDLHSGMILEADILLERLSIIDWLLEPIYSVTGKT